jgi:hypothetical protein
MTASALLPELRQRRVELVLEGDSIRYRAPKAALTPELVAAMTEHKAALLRHLRSSDPAMLTRTSLPTSSPPSGHGSYTVTPAAAESDGAARTPRPELSLNAAARQHSTLNSSTRVSSSYAFPWPDVLRGLGARRTCPFDFCIDCAAGTWVRYGGVALCLRCAQRREAARI